MLQRIKELVSQGESFAFETTLATRSYQNLIKSAKKERYETILLFLTLDSKELAIRRVATRVSEGGHNIPPDVIERRYVKGMLNLFNIYMKIVDKWILVDNSDEDFEFIAEGSNSEYVVNNEKKWSNLREQYNGN